MSIDFDDEIVNDFMVEAGEILDRLSGELVELEVTPADVDLLNSVFRGFHTIKGGAGFLALDNMVVIAHKAEDLFDLLRQGKRAVDAELMDSILEVLDVLNNMFDALRNGKEPEAASPALIETLLKLADPSFVKPDHSAKDVSNDEITEDEFEQLLDAISNKQASSEVQVEAVDGSASDLIDEDEFEQLLDELHGKGKSITAPDTQDSAVSADDISEDEFEALLDEIHGKGKYNPTAVAAVKSSVVVPEPAPATPAVIVPALEAKRANKSRTGTHGSQADSTVRVETSTLDQIMNMVGELVLLRNRLSTLEVAIGNEEMTKTVSTLDIITSDLQSAAMKTRMQPIKKVFGRFPRVIRDMARSLNKEIVLEMSGEDTDLDKNLVEALSDPLVHLVRNSVDHGIEMPDLREAAGKPRTGTIRLSAETEGDHILLMISDDGAGMDPDTLRNKAVEKGMMDADAAARLSERECFELIFMAGFSTRLEVSDISGRGVGLDVVKTRIGQLNGIVEIDSKLGQGTSLSIKLPLTLAIMPTLMVVLGEQIFALPLVNVNEIVEFKREKQSVVDGKNVLLVRDKVLPLFYLRHWLVKGGSQMQDDRAGHVVIVNIGTQRVGLLVDHLIGQEEVVIKPLGAMLQGTQGLSGATITGDGRIALILDLSSLVKHYA